LLLLLLLLLRQALHHKGVVLICLRLFGQEAYHL
jgi:hypothetical protein